MADKIEIKALIRPDLDTGGVVKKVSTIQSLLKKIDLPPTLQKEFNGLFNDFNDNIDKINNAFSKGFETKGSVKSLNSLTSHMEKITDKIIAKWNQASSNEGFAKQFSPEIASQIDNIDKEIKDLRDSITKLNAKPLGDIKQMVEELKGQGAKKTGNQVASLLDQGDLKQAIGLLTLTIEKRKSLNETMFKGAAKTTLDNDNKALEKMLNALLKIDEKSDALKKIEDLKTDKVKHMADLMASVEKACKEAGVDVATLGEQINKTGSNIDDAAASAQQFTSEVDEIKDRIKYFFSLSNAVQLVRQALRQTFEAAKELDAAMTETAVVTDFSVSDMWGMLPQYTKTAQKLGATTQGVYETLTLFYQQGLNTNEAMALGTETLKMARIAGMDYEEATSKMTAALRGFNMELNELSAQRVNDVYSELAAITAADTDQIATAMTKTASIANSANMEFETTAAFLAQIVETTQESAETAGTAMKTVIARFTELKKDPSLIGEVDGEVVDANKIESALKSIGVALRDNLTGQFRDLDEVFLDIAGKWGSLTTNTQRYIATIAAGSRQQSRFIAMMSDYERTMQLVNAANNSAGSSQAQFDKTLESMEAKLNQLKNTWQEFTLGLMDQGALKGTIEVLNGILTAINKITDLPGILGSASKAFVSFFLLFTGKKLFNVFEGVLSSQIKSFQSGGKVAAMTWRQSFEQEFKKTKINLQKNFRGLFSFTGKDGKALTSFIPKNGTKQISALVSESKELSEAYEKAQASSLAFKNQLERYNLTIDQSNNLEEAKIGLIEKVYLKQLKEKEALDKSNLSKTQELVQQAAIAQVYDLSGDQIAEYNSIKQLGISSDLAAAAAKAGVTTAQLRENAATALSIPLDRQLTAEEEKQIAVEMKNQLLREQGILVRLKEKVIKVGSIAMTKLETAATKANTTGKIANWLAQKLVNKEMLAGTLIIAGAALLVAGLTAAIALLVKVSKESTLDYKMQQAAEATEKAKQSAEQTKEAYDELLSSKKEFDDLQNSLKQLTYGTLEWRKSLVEANSQVLQLLKTYPKLAQHVVKNSDGSLFISSEGWDEVLKYQLQSVEVSNQALLLRQYQEHNLNRPQYTREILDITNGETNWWDSAIAKLSAMQIMEQDTGLSPELTEHNRALAENALVQGGAAVDVSGELLSARQNGEDILSRTSETVLHLANLTGKTVDDILQYSPKVEEYYNELQNFNNQAAIYAQQIGASTSEISNLKTGKDLAWMLGERFVEQYDELYEEIKPEIPRSYEEAVRDYANALGISEETVKEQFEDSKEGFKKLQKEIGNLKVSQSINKKAKEFAKAWTNFEKMEQENISALGSYGGKSLTIDQISNFNSAKAIETYLKTAGITNEQAKELFGYDSLQTMAESYFKNVETANKALEKSQELIQSLTGEINLIQDKSYKRITKNMTVGMQKQFNDIISSLILDSGSALSGAKYIDLISSTMNKLSLTAKQKLIDNISFLELDDIKNTEDFLQTLQAIGISASELSKDELKDLEKEIVAFSTIVRKKIVDIAEAERVISSGQKAKEIVQTAIDEENVVFDEDEYQALKAGGASSSDFFYDGETYTYLGNTVDLLQQIKDDTLAMRKKLLAQAEQNAIGGAQIADWLEGNQFEKGKWFVESESYTMEALIAEALVGNPIKAYQVDANGNPIEEKKTWDTKTLLTSFYKYTGNQEMLEQIATWGPEMIKAELQRLYDLYGTGGSTYQQNLEQVQTYYDEQYGAIAFQQSAIENAQMYKEASEDLQIYQALLDSGVQLTQEQQLAHIKATKAVEKSTQALKQKGKALGLSNEEMEKYLGQGKSGTGLLGQIIAEKELEQKIKKTTEATKDYFDILDNSPDEVDRDKALNKIAETAKLELGLNIDADWLKQADNLEAFRKAINGTKEDFYSFIATLETADQFELLGIKNEAAEVAQAFSDARMIIATESSEMEKIINALNGVDFTIDGTADFTQVYQAILAVVQDAAAAEAILKQLAGNGVAFDVSYVEKIMYLPNTQTTYDTIPLDPRGGSAWMSNYRMQGGTVLSGYTPQKVKLPQITGRLIGGTGNYYSPSDFGSGTSGGGGSGSNGNKKSQKTDPAHNVKQKIAATQEKRNELEREYEKLLKDEVPDLEAVKQNLEGQLQLLEDEKSLLLQRKQIHKDSLEQAIKDYSKYSEYFWYDSQVGKVMINNSAIDAITDEDLRSEVEEAQKEMESLVGEIVETDESIYDIESQISDLREKGKNDLDEQLNKVEKINELEKKRNKISSDLNLLQNERKLNEKQYLETLEAERKILDDNVKQAGELKDLREQDLKEFIKELESNGYLEYMSYDFSSKEAFLDKNKVDALPQEQQDLILEAFDKLVDKSEDYEDAIEDEIEALEENSEALKERREGTIETIEFVRDLLIEAREREIESYQEISDSISESNSRIIESINDSLSRQREQRDNTETEADLNDMRNRLAYLQMDTSGANQNEILNLQKQILEKEEDYTDTLIDQKISELEKQNDQAAEQRERQIGLMEWQLQNDQDTGTITKKALLMLQNGLDENGVIISGSPLDKLINESGELKGLSDLEKLNVLNTISADLVKYFDYMTKDRLVGTAESGFEIGQDVSSQFGLIKGSAKITGEGEVTFGNGYKISGITAGGWNDMNLSLADTVDYQELYASAATAREVMRAAVGLSNASGLTDPYEIAKKMPHWDVDKDGRIGAADARDILRAAVGLENLNDKFYNEADLLLLLAARQDASESEFDKLYKETVGQDPPVGTVDSKIQYFVDNLLGNAKKFATGGLANYTGPAWLDGTKSRPELVLNQRDTQNFLQLKDILASFMSNNNSLQNSAENRGDNYYEIHLNVEKITSDYDVEQLANKVKLIIAEDANSRGVNSIYRRR